MIDPRNNGIETRDRVCRLQAQILYWGPGGFFAFIFFTAPAHCSAPAQMIVRIYNNQEIICLCIPNMKIYMCVRVSESYVCMRERKRGHSMCVRERTRESIRM